MSVDSQFVVLVMNMSERMGINLVPNARLGTRGIEVSVCSLLLFYFLYVGVVKWMRENLDLDILSGSVRVEGDDEEDDVDDIENELDYAKGNAKARRQWEDDAELSSSSRRDYQQPIPLLTNGQTVLHSTLLWLPSVDRSHFRFCEGWRAERLFIEQLTDDVSGLYYTPDTTYVIMLAVFKCD